MNCNLAVLNPVVHSVSMLLNLVFDSGQRVLDEFPCDVDIGGIDPVVIDGKSHFLHNKTQYSTDSTEHVKNCQPYLSTLATYIIYHSF